jgi:hypothetical protein
MEMGVNMTVSRVVAFLCGAIVFGGIARADDVDFYRGHPGELQDKISVAVRTGAYACGRVYLRGDDYHLPPQIIARHVDFVIGRWLSSTAFRPEYLLDRKISHGDDLKDVYSYTNGSFIGSVNRDFDSDDLSVDSVKGRVLHTTTSHSSYGTQITYWIRSQRVNEAEFLDAIDRLVIQGLIGLICK